MDLREAGLAAERRADMLASTAAVAGGIVSFGGIQEEICCCCEVQVAMTEMSDAL